LNWVAEPNVITSTICASVKRMGQTESKHRTTEAQANAQRV
jgi:hypothetical protein